MSLASLSDTFFINYCLSVTVAWPGSIPSGGLREFLDQNWFGAFLVKEQRSLFKLLEKNKSNQTNEHTFKGRMIVKAEE